MRGGAHRGRQNAAVELDGPDDLDLAAFRRIAWDGEGLQVSPAGLERVARRRQAFEAYVDANAAG